MRFNFTKFRPKWHILKKECAANSQLFVKNCQFSKKVWGVPCRSVGSVGRRFSFSTSSWTTRSRFARANTIVFLLFSSFSSWSLFFRFLFCLLLFYLFFSFEKGPTSLFLFFCCVSPSRRPLHSLSEEQQPTYQPNKWVILWGFVPYFRGWIASCEFLYGIPGDKALLVRFHPGFPVKCRFLWGFVRAPGDGAHLVRFCPGFPGIGRLSTPDPGDEVDRVRLCLPPHDCVEDFLCTTQISIGFPL